MKRFIDCVYAICFFLIFFAPFFALALIVRVKLGSPILFRQVRPGLEARPFEMVKFRTMTNERGLDGLLLPDAQRLTKFGRFLRATSLDELPEVWNVLKGDMSFVGPRPLVVEYLPLYSAFESRRHEVRPGITGWAQVNGRNAISWKQKFEYDVWYVDNKSFFLDLKILFFTVKKVLTRSDVLADGQDEVSSFNGNN